jgi:hypothetical protein
MAVINLPLRNDLAHFDFTIALDGTTYRFLFRWNSRGEAWYLSCSLEDDTPVFAGVKVVIGFPLASRCKHEQRPPGLLVAFDSDEQQVAPGLTDLGARVRILYFDRDSTNEFRTELGLATG